jgi:hypothetical protein
MKRRQRFFVLMLIAAFIASSFVFSSFSYARPTGSGGGCNNGVCNGFDIGGGSAQFSNSGSCSPSSVECKLDFVRFDGFAPVPGALPCPDSDADKSQYAKLNIPKNFSGDVYPHYRVGVRRSDGVIIGGVPGSLYWDEYWNAETGAHSVTRPPGITIKSAPSRSNPWVAPHWTGKEFCLPLSGGTPLSAQLGVTQPTVETTLHPASVSASGIPPVIPGVLSAAVGMKKSKVTVHLDQAVVNQAISIGFSLDDVVIIGCKIKEPVALNPNHDCVDGSGFTNINSNGAIRFKNFHINGYDATADVKFKKRGLYKFYAGGLFTGTVIVNGVRAAQVPNIPSISTEVDVQVISIRSKNVN